MIEQFYLIYKWDSNPVQSCPGSNENQTVFLILQNSWTGASPSDAVQCHTQDTRSGRDFTVRLGLLWEWKFVVSSSGMVNTLE